MHTVSTKRNLLVALAAATCCAAACSQTATDPIGSREGSLESMNGFSMNGFSMNGFSMNGLSMNGFSMNGFSMNGLSLTNGLSSTTGLMTTSGGREVIKYMVKCAYPNGQNLVKQDQYGTSYTFYGSIGIAPELATGTCDLDCQERVSACMLAHVNNSGQHISIWMVGPDSTVGWGADADYPYQEGAYFGNIIATPWQGYYCNGKDMASGEVPGRLGTPMSSTVYVDPYGANGNCQQGTTACTALNQGYAPCNDPAPMAPYTTGHKWNHVITVWRNFEATQMYKICNVYSGKCLGVANGSTSSGASIEQRTYSGTGGQDWQILQVSSGNYKVVNVASGMALDVNGTQLVQRTYSGSASQLLPIKYSPGNKGYANLVLSSNTKSGLWVSSNTDGALVQMSSTLGSDNARWTFMAVGPVSAAPTGGTTSGSSGGTNPCAAFCSSPTVFTTSNYQAGALGTGAVCRETTASLAGVNFSNIAGRTLTVNGTAFTADGTISALPAKVNGGYCIQASAGGLSYASFATW
jgi:hypothetical protein